MSKKTILLFILFFFVKAVYSQYSAKELLVQLNDNSDIKNTHAQISKLIPGDVKVNLVSKRVKAYLFKFESEITNQDLERIKTLSTIKSLNYNYIGSLRDTCVDDPIFPQQWSLENTGLIGNAGADINACQAWDLSLGDTTIFGDTIVVAVIDNGFALNHSDINYWVNIHDTIDGIDNDGNGFKDDYRGWNTISDTNNITGQSHGTAVLSIVSTKTDNSLGIAGVAKNIKAIPVQGAHSLTNSIEAFEYVISLKELYYNTNGAKGAFIVAVNFSYGWDNEQVSFFPALCDIIDSLGNYGIMSVGATENSTDNIDITGDLPSVCPIDHHIVVTNTTATDERHPNFAAIGPMHVDIGAPGTQVWRATTSNSFTNSSGGTSFAAPHVTGAVAILFSIACEDMMRKYESHPREVLDLIKTYILDNATPIPDLAGVTVSGGRLDMGKAAKYLDSICPTIYLGTDDIIEISENVNVFPNPSNGLFTVDNLTSDNMKMRVFDYSGRLIRLQRINNGKNQLNLTGFSKGVYLLNFSSNTTHFTKKIIKL